MTFVLSPILLVSGYHFSHARQFFCQTVANTDTSLLQSRATIEVFEEEPIACVFFLISQAPNRITHKTKYTR